MICDDSPMLSFSSSLSAVAVSFAAFTDVGCGTKARIISSSESKLLLKSSATHIT